MIQIQELSVITFMGKDADTFLHNQLTADIQSLEPGQCTFASLCQPKGRVMALLLVMRVAGGFQVVCRRSLAERLVNYLLRFRFREQVDITVQDDLAVVALDDKDPKHDALIPLPGVAFAILDADAAPAPDPDAAEHTEASHLARGVVWLDEFTTEQFLPQMLGQEAIGALNFRKGCFPGQEIIARTRYLGKLKRHPWSGRTKDSWAAELLQEVELNNGEQQASGVLVARARRADGGEQVFVVARRPEAFAVTGLKTNGETLKASGEWLSREEPSA